MVTKMKKGAAADSAEANARASQLSGAVKESAQQIWLAGLGAFSKAQEEGGKVFDTLVKEGVAIQRKTQAAAEEKITEATSRMATMATDISSRASGQWDKLETIFEERVNRALKKLGVPTATDVDALVSRVEQLQRSVEKLAGKDATSRPAARKAARPVAKPPAKAATKRAARKSA